MIQPATLLDWHTFNQDPHIVLKFITDRHPLYSSCLLRTRLFAQIQQLGLQHKIKQQQFSKQIQAAQKATSQDQERYQTGLQKYLLDRYQELKKEGFEKQKCQSVISDYKASVTNSSDKDLEDCVQYAKILYEQGKYNQSKKILFCLQNQFGDKNVFEEVNLQWAVLYASIVTEDYQIFQRSAEVLYSSIRFYNDLIFFNREQYLSSQVRYLQCYLFYAYSSVERIHKFPIQLERFKGTIKSALPYLGRYISAGFLLSVNFEDCRYANYSQIVEEIRNLSYSDQFTKLLIYIFGDFNFREASQLIPQLESSAKADFFLRPYADQLIRKVKQLLLIQKMKLFSAVSLTEIEQISNAKGLYAQKWLIKVLKKSSIDAKIDQQKGSLLLSAVSRGQIDCINNLNRLSSRSRVLE